MTDFPSTVAVTGILVLRASLRSWSCKPNRCTSTSARITGRSEVKRMVLANDGLPEHSRGHGDIGLARELEELVLQAEPVHLHVCQDNRQIGGKTDGPRQ